MKGIRSFCGSSLRHMQNIFCENKFNRIPTSVADFHAVFGRNSGKIGQIVGWRTPLWKILDTPLNIVRFSYLLDDPFTNLLETAVAYSLAKTFHNSTKIFLTWNF